MQFFARSGMPRRSPSAIFSSQRLAGVGPVVCTAPPMHASRATACAAWSAVRVHSSWQVGAPDPQLSDRERTVKALKWIAVLVAIGVAVVFFAARQGASDQRRMQAALQLTGNYVGMTEAQISELGTRLGQGGRGTVGEAREVLFRLACSGRFASAMVESAARAALALVSARGISEKEAVARLVPATRTSSGDPSPIAQGRALWRPSLHPTRYSGLRPPPRAGELKCSASWRQPAFLQPRR